MKKNTLLAILLGLMLIVSACTFSTNIATNNSKTTGDLPVYKNAKTIKLDASDEEKLMVDLFGYEATLFSRSFDMRVTDDLISDVSDKLDEMLVKDKWRYETTLIYEMWRKGDEVLYLYKLDNLTSSQIDELYRSYGVSDIKPGQSLLITYSIDTANPLPNPTHTALANASIQRQPPMFSRRRRKLSGKPKKRLKQRK
jgi:hypothetical protein